MSSSHPFTTAIYLIAVNEWTQEQRSESDRQVAQWKPDCRAKSQWLKAPWRLWLLRWRKRDLFTFRSRNVSLGLNSSVSWWKDWESIKRSMVQMAVQAASNQQTEPFILTDSHLWLLSFLDFKTQSCMRSCEPPISQGSSSWAAWVWL